jgi:hypothetical protein
MTFEFDNRTIYKRFYNVYQDYIRKSTRRSAWKAPVLQTSQTFRSSYFGHVIAATT